MKKKQTIVTTSWDDGHPLDLKLSSMLQSQKIPGTFYIPLKNQEFPTINDNEIRLLSNFFEIGAHTFNHVELPNLSESKILDELQSSKLKLEEITHDDITSFCYPRGKHSLAVRDLVKKSGYNFARTTELFETKIIDPFLCGTTLQCVNRSFASKIKQLMISHNTKLKLKLMSGTVYKNWNVIAKKTFDYVVENGGIWHLWGHSWEIDANNDWENLRDVLEYVRINGLKNNVEFLNNNQIST